ncbi:MAG: hypothetical protein F6K17_16045 [Okeania sp. SIO3C4]|nr:hypothetical protein [Okeania sp. SIO3C4]
MKQRMQALTRQLARLELNFGKKKPTKDESQKLGETIKYINKAAARKFGTYNDKSTEETINKKINWLEEQIQIQKQIAANKDEDN